MKKLLAGKFSDLIIPVLVAVFNVLIILFPKEMIAAARDGLNLWLGNVLPSLLPFIIGMGILSGLGAINFLGTLLEPFMYTLFGVPGAGSFALITSMTSGYPIGAKIVAVLRKKKELTKVEAQRLISFANNSGPLFIVGAVGIGMLSSAKAGYIMLAAHYTGAIITGMIFKNYGHSESKAIRYEKSRMSKAIYNMRLARAKDGRPFGRLMGDAIKNAMETIAQVGGFIILFSVIIKILFMAEETFIKNGLLGGAQQLNGEYYGIFKSLLIGAVEITNGCREVSSSGLIKVQIILCSGIISFGGFSVHAQALSFLSGTDIKAFFYIIAKLIHACIAAFIAWIICRFIDFPETTSKTVETFLLYREGFVNKLTASSLCFACSICIIALSVVLASIIRGRRRY